MLMTCKYFFIPRTQDKIIRRRLANVKPRAAGKVMPSKTVRIASRKTFYNACTGDRFCLRCKCFKLVFLQRRQEAGGN